MRPALAPIAALTICLAVSLGCPQPEGGPAAGTESTDPAAGSESTDPAAGTGQAAGTEPAGTEAAPAGSGDAPTAGTGGSGKVKVPTVPPTTDPLVDPSPVQKPPEKSPIPAGKKYKRCAEMRPVTKGNLETAEGTLWFVFEALLRPNDDDAFNAFYALIDPDYQRRDSARRYWFRAARKDNGKSFKRLVFGDKDPSFVVCEVRKEGPELLRIFVGKSPPVGSNPPFSLHKVKGKWKLKTFTPH